MGYPPNAAGKSSGNISFNNSKSLVKNQMGLFDPEGRTYGRSIPNMSS